jgi:hypothetical protein
LYALDLNTGETVWRKDISGVEFRPGAHAAQGRKHADFRQWLIWVRHHSIALAVVSSYPHHGRGVGACVGVIHVLDPTATSSRAATTGSKIVFRM